ncbi:hypothetical protein NE471_27285 [Escherichia coli]|nr:hypothetical protein [Escherichia coli]
MEKGTPAWQDVIKAGALALTESPAC